MYLIRAVNAYAALLPLMEQEMPYAAAHTIAETKRTLQPHAEFFAKEEQKLVAQYAARTENGDIQWTAAGSFQFKSQQAAAAYEKKRLELCGVEVEEDLRPVELETPDKIRPMQIEALEGIVRFRERSGT